jgi:hypothetical protein
MYIFVEAAPLAAPFVSGAVSGAVAGLPLRCRFKAHTKIPTDGDAVVAGTGFPARRLPSKQVRDEKWTRRRPQLPRVKVKPRR